MLENIWEEVKKSNRLDILFQEQSNVMNFIEKSNITRCEFGKNGYLFEVTDGVKTFVFTKDGFGWGYPSSAFVEFGTNLKALFKLFDEMIQKLH